MLYTLITGASSGLGRAFAVECARKGQHLILMALPGSSMHALGYSLEQQFGIAVKLVELDLTDIPTLRANIAALTEKYTIQFLINNAGIGGSAAITETPAEKLDNIIQLNVRTTSLLTHWLVPHLLKLDQAYILNVSSMAAFTPIAYKTVYPASKAFISSFSLGLREELTGTGVSVSVLYPGPLMTNYSTSRRILLQGRKAQWGLLSTSEVARLAIQKTLQKKPVIIPGFLNRLSRSVLQWLPLDLKLRLVSREIKREILLSNL